MLLTKKIIMQKSLRPPSSYHVLWIPLLATLLAPCRAQLPSGRSCFCKLSENVDECACSVDSVDSFNNNQIYPLIQALLERDFFRYYKVNMEKPCPFWVDERQCGSEACGIEHCDEKVPQALKEGDPVESGFCTASGEEAGNEIDPLITHISEGARDKLHDMDAYDDSENKFCELDDHQVNGLHYVDLLGNPERYTGYKGNSAQRVWTSIYMENCFKPHPKFDKKFLMYPSLTGLCLEKRVFFRIISGLHTSITVSIAAHNYTPPPGGFGQGTWSRNLPMFKGRFSAETTGGEGPQRLKNLYFLYLLELRALHKVAPYLQQELFYTGNEAEDKRTRELVEELRSKINTFPDHYDETGMFQYNSADARQLKEQFRVRFHNISRIMDCVDCDKCRLWGKVQVHGIGTALKVLFSDITPRHPFEPTTISSEAASKRLPRFRLSRNDIVALFQSFGRFAANIRELAEFRKEMDVL